MGTEARLALVVDPDKGIAALRRFDQAVGTTESRMSKFARGVKRDLEIVAAAAGGAVVGLSAKFIGMASDAEEVRAKFGVVFKGMEDDATKWAVSYGDAVGRATTEIQRQMAGLQDVFVPLGYGREQAMGLSKAVVSLATDVASFSNAADADVIRDFTSAMVGNHETVRKYGIIISEAAIEQEALTLGLGKTYKELTDLEKVTLRYAIIQKSSTDAIGDAIRTADSYANQTKRLKANIAELGVELGDRLLPAANKALTGLNTWFTDNRSAINRWADDFKEGVEIVTDAMDRLHEKAFKQSSVRSMFEGFGPATQKEILRAYQSQTGQSFGMTDVVVPGMMGGWAGQVWREPADEQYARRLMESYRRAQAKRWATDIQRMNATAPGGDGADALDVKDLLAQPDSGAWRRLGDAMLWPGEQLMRLNDLLREYGERRQKADAITGSYLEDLRFERDLLRMTNTEQEKAVIVRQAQQEALRSGTELWGGEIDLLKRAVDELHRADKMKAIGDEIGFGFARGFQQATMHARTLSDALDYLGDAAMNVLDRVMELTIWEPMAQSISKGVTNFMPKPRASGGGVYPGEWYMTGERGRELVQFDRPGTVYPNHQTEAMLTARGGQAPQVYVNVNNTSQAQVDVAKPDIRFDGQRLLVGMTLKDKRNYGPMSRGQRRS